MVKIIKSPSADARREGPIVRMSISNPSAKKTVKVAIMPIGLGMSVAKTVLSNLGVMAHQQD